MPIDPDSANYLDMCDAMRDATTIRVTGQRPQNLHPHNIVLADPSLEIWSSALHRNLTSSDFSAALAGAYGAVVSQTGNRFEEEVGLCCSTVGVKDFKPMEVVSIVVEPAVETFEDSGATFAKVAAAVQSGQLRTFEVILKFSRTLLINDDRLIIDQAVTQAIMALRRIDLQLLAAVLTENANLSDGNPLFGASNAVSGSGHTATALDSAISLLATQADSYGGLSCARPATILCHPGLLASYAKLAADLSPVLNIEVHANPYNASGTAYLFADPQETNAITRLRRLDRNDRLVGVQASGIIPKQADGSRYNGVGVMVYLDTAVVAASRLGVVRIEA